MQPHPSNIGEWSRTVTGTGLLGPLMVTDRDIRSTFHRGLVSICNNYELKQLLNVTDQDKTSQRPYHRRLHSSAKSAVADTRQPHLLTSFPGFLISSNVNRSTLCPDALSDEIPADALPRMGRPAPGPRRSAGCTSPYRPARQSRTFPLEPSQKSRRETPGLGSSGSRNSTCSSGSRKAVRNKERSEPRLAAVFGQPVRIRRNRLCPAIPSPALAIGAEALAQIPT